MRSLLYTYLVVLMIYSCGTETAKKTVPVPEVDSWVLSGFVKQDSINPILRPSDSLFFDCPLSGKQVRWEVRNVLNPSAVVKNDRVYLFYRAQDSLGTSRIGLAISDDGLHFKKQKHPVFYPDRDSMNLYEWNYRKRNKEEITENCKSCYFDGVEDPRIIQRDDGTFIMTYTAYDGKKARLAIASSKDLRNWKKHGLVLKGSSFENYWSKSGAIVGHLQDNQVVATKINDKYWMYFGDTELYLAHSEDLINWEVARNDENQEMIAVLHPRKGYFDSRLVEPGPFALLGDQGILLIYNASNASNFNDSGMPEFTYAAGQALFDKKAPYKLIDRTIEDFIHPEKDYEMVGEVNNVCFVEGLVFFKKKWFLYYGTGDSKIAVAVSNNRKQ